MFSGYSGGRRAPNVSAYLTNLNTIPSAHDVEPEIDLGDEGLNFLTNTQFVDFDAEFNQPNAYAPSNPNMTQPKDGRFEFPDFSTYPSTGMTSPTNVPTPQNRAFPALPDQFSLSPQLGDKPKASEALPVSGDLEEVSRMAAEEDKRRRNTAASARFRVKKKQREAALEKQAKEMTDKVTLLEGKVEALERENRWLKELITEKNDTKPAADAAEKGTIAAVERSTGSRTDGVGTDAKAVKPEA